jgi:hypothetical protein
MMMAISNVSCALTLLCRALAHPLEVALRLVIGTRKQSTQMTPFDMSGRWIIMLTR